MDPTSMAMTFSGACGYLLAGLVLLVVGAVSARPVEPRAGYLAIAAGLFMMLDGCCNLVPMILIETSGDFETVRTVSMCNGWLAIPILLVEGVGLIGAAFLLAQKLTSTEAKPS